MNEAFEIGNGQAANTDIHEVCGTLDCMHDQKAILDLRGGTMDEPQVIENHPNDSRIKINKSNTFQTLSGRMGTGGE